MNQKITKVYDEASIKDANSLKLVLFTKYQNTCRITLQMRRK